MVDRRQGILRTLGLDQVSTFCQISLGPHTYLRPLAENSMLRGIDAYIHPVHKYLMGGSSLLIPTGNGTISCTYWTSAT